MNLNQLTIAPVFPLWLMGLLFCLGLASALIQYRVTRGKLGEKRALILSLIRLGAISFIIAFALNPSMVTRKEHQVSPAIAILVDTSRSMGQPALSIKGTRLDEAKAILTDGANPLLQSLGERFEVSLYGLADSLRPLEPGDLAGLKAEGNKGEVGEAIKTLRARHDVALLLSDGHLKWSETDARDLPMITVPVGSLKEYRDILIKGIRAPGLAFRDRQVVIDVTVKGYGYKGLAFPVLLKDSSRLLTAKDVRIEANCSEVTTSLSFVPTEVGKKHLSISIPQQVGERLVTNNQISFSLQVIPDKTRILMVSGRPSMNYRFMRNAFKSDPSIDLLSFVILRTPSDVLNVRPLEQSLIPFPVETLFSKELANFDILIFDNFNYSIFLNPDHLESVRKFVKEGGGFAMIGGPNLFYEEREALSPIGDILPFRFIQKEFYQRDSPFRVKLSKAGAKHPLTRFSDDFREQAADLLRSWQDLPPLDGINLMEAKRSSTVLVESADGFPWPILTVGEYGKGRVLGLATDYAWKWYMGLVARGKAPQPYLEIIHRIGRWLVKDPRLDPVQILLPERSPLAGQEIDTRIQLRGGSVAEMAESAISFSVYDPQETKTEAKLTATQQPGEYLISFLPKEEGIYRIRIETPLGPLEESVLVAGPFERFDAAPDPDQLKKIAAVTGGKYMSQGDDLKKEIEAYGQRAEKRLIEEKRLPIWATPIGIALALGLLASEWYLRRRWGLV